MHDDDADPYRALTAAEVARDRLHVGFVVELASGGPHMTVALVLESGMVRCAWFADRTLLTEDIPTVCLRTIRS